MATKQSSVELILKARDEAKKTVQELRDTLSELADEQAGVSKAFGETSKSSDDLKKTLRDLNTVARDLTNKDKLVNAFQQQGKAAQESRQQWELNRNTLRSLETEISNAGVPTRKLVSDYEKARKKTLDLNKAYLNQEKGLRSLGKALESNGIDYKNLGTAQNEFNRLARETKKQINATEKELADLAAQSKRTSTALNATGGSKAISFFSRLRSELVAVALAYGGVRAAGNLVQGVFDTSQLKEAALSRLRVGFDGDGQAAADELEYVREEADRLGLSVETLIEGYSKFVSSSANMGFAGKDLRTVFKGLTEAAVVNRLSNDDLGGVLNAVTQIMSKGTVQAEELRGQLGERLPGAIVSMADALGVTTEELSKMLEQGERTFRDLLPFAEELSDKYKNELAAAIESPTAKLARFQNQIFELKEEIGNSGFLEQMVGALDELTYALKRSDVRAGARAIGQAFSYATKGLVFFIKHFSVFRDLLVSYAAGRAATGIVSLLGFLATLRVRALSAVTAVATLRGGLALLGGPVGVLIGLGTALAVFVGQMKKSEQALEDFAEEAERTNRTLDQVARGRTLFDRQKRDVEEIAKLYDELAKLKKVRESVLSAANPGNGVVFEGLLGSVDSIDKDIAKAKRALDELNALQEKTAAELAELFKPPKKKGEDEEAESTKKSTFIPKLGKELTKELKRLEGELQNSYQQLKEAEADTLDERLALIADKYQQLIASVAGAEQQLQTQLANLLEASSNPELSAAVVDDYKARIATIQTELAKLAQAKPTLLKLVAVEQGQERDKFADEQQKQALSELRDLEQSINLLLAERQRQLEEINIKTQTGQITQSQSLSQVAEVNETIIPQLDLMIEKALKFAESLGDEATIARLKAVQASFKSTGDQVVITTDQVNEMAASGLTSAFKDWINGAKSAKDAFKDFAANFLSKISEMIIQQAILNALQSTGFGGAVAGAANSASAGVQHEGGITGSGNPTRTVPSWVFNRAPRYHGGGIAGLKPNEVPSILERGEEVLTADDPRHSANGGGQGEANVKIINMIDSGSVVSEGLNTAGGEKAVINVIRANKEQLKTVLS